MTINLPWVLISIFLFLLVGLFAYLWYQEQARARKLSKQNNHLENTIQKLQDDLNHSNEDLQWHQKIFHSIRAGKEKYVLIGALIGLGSSPVDLLTEAQRILFYQGKVSLKETAEDSKNLIISLLRTSADVTNFHPLAPYHQIVKFDHRIHQSDHIIPDGTQVMIIETGWHIDDLIVKKAFVTTDWGKENAQ